MKTKGIRIFDRVNGIVTVDLSAVLNEVSGGSKLNWSILYIEALSDYKAGKSIPVNEDEINDSKIGLFISWNDLIKLAPKFYQITDLVLIGCKDKSLLHRYQNNKKMQDSCDIVIMMCDASFWDIFSKDEQFISRLGIKFRDIQYIDSDHSQGIN